MKTSLLLATGIALILPVPLAAQDSPTKADYASVNGLKMYYEIHGDGMPLVLLHGAFGFAEGWRDRKSVV